MKHFALAVPGIILLGSLPAFAQQNAHDMKSMSGSDSSEHHMEMGSTTSATNADAKSTQQTVDPKVAASVKNIVELYLQMKNALANDRTKDAATAGKNMAEAMGTMDKSLLTADQKQVYHDIDDDAREHAEHIGANAGNIEHQREHFAMLSKDVYDLVKEFGTPETLYKDFCPMYNDKEGAIWLSESKTIKNPYYGKKMVTCGSVQEEVK